MHWGQQQQRADGGRTAVGPRAPGGWAAGGDESRADATEREKVGVVDRSSRGRRGKRQCAALSNALTVRVRSTRSFVVVVVVAHLGALVEEQIARRECDLCATRAGRRGALDRETIIHVVFIRLCWREPSAARRRATPRPSAPGRGAADRRNDQPGRTDPTRAPSHRRDCALLLRRSRARARARSRRARRRPRAGRHKPADGSFLVVQPPDPYATPVITNRPRACGRRAPR